MHQLDAEVLSNTELLPGLRLLWLDAPEAARATRPGQFVFVRCSDGPEPVLRRAVSIHRVGPGILPGDERSGPPTRLALLYGTAGHGVAYLQRYQPGDVVNIIAPLGHGFAVHAATRNVLLVGGGIGVAPLVNLADFCIREGRSVTLLVGAQHGRQVFPSHLLPPEVEIIVATQDGSLGHHGMITELLPAHLDWADQVFCCGPVGMYETIGRAVFQQGQRKQVQVLMDAPMMCGVGTCGTCAVETRRGNKLVCHDGPRFDVRDLYG